MCSIGSDRSQAADDGHQPTQKRRAILDAGATVFLRSGFPGTSMDEIAARSGVSKQTVYKHFSDKGSLFTEIVTSMVNEASDTVSAGLQALNETRNLEEDLCKLATQQLRLVMKPRMMQLRRLVISEVARFPKLARLFYECGPERTILALAETFERLSARDLLCIDKPLMAASHYNWLVMSDPLNRAMLLGDELIPNDAELDKHAAEATRAFLAIYSTQPRTPEATAP